MTVFQLAILISILALPQTELPSWVNERFAQFSTNFELSDHLNPNFLEIDLDSDDTVDIALFVRKKSDIRLGFCSY